MTIQQLKDRWKGWRKKRFLETHGCKTWREYELRHDSDVGYMARFTHNYYHGYNNIWSYPHEAPTFAGNGWSFARLDDMVVWCEQNCRGKWRNDWHRGFWDHQGNFEINVIGGTDIMFFAFKEESDYVWFKLVWE